MLMSYLRNPSKHTSPLLVNTRLHRSSSSTLHHDFVTFCNSTTTTTFIQVLASNPSQELKDFAVTKFQSLQALADYNKHIQIREKMLLEFSSVMLHTLSPYHYSLQCSAVSAIFTSISCHRLTSMTVWKLKSYQLLHNFASEILS